jgi:type IV pilus assembly protein PilW
MRRSIKKGSFQSGFTLIELLISITLGFVVIGAVLVMHQTGSAATRMAVAQGQMNEDGQMALSVLAHELRIAGFNPTRNVGGARNDLGQGGWTIFGCDNTFTDETVPLVSGLTCTAGAGNAAIALVSEGDDFSGRRTNVANLPMDCIGNGVAGVLSPIDGGTYHAMQARIYITNNAIMCKGSGDLTQAQALAENIDSLVVRYGVTNAANQVLGYLSANAINTAIDANLVALTPLQRWDRVVSAQICVVVMSENRLLNDIRDQTDATANPTYRDCDDALVAITDGRLRRSYRTTVLLRNHGVGFIDA